MVVLKSVGKVILIFVLMSCIDVSLFCEFLVVCILVMCFCVLSRKSMLGKMWSVVVMSLLEFFWFFVVLCLLLFGVLVFMLILSWLKLVFVSLDWFVELFFGEMLKLEILVVLFIVVCCGRVLSVCRFVLVMKLLCSVLCFCLSLVILLMFVLVISMLLMMMLVLFLY